MNFFRKLQVEPKPASAPKLSALERAEEELAASGRQCAEAIQRCESLDAEKRDWPARREAAFAYANNAMQRHSKAKENLARLSEPVFLKGCGNVAPLAVATGSVVVVGEN
jgi:hypothetical protein